MIYAFLRTIELEEGSEKRMQLHKEIGEYVQKYVDSIEDEDITLVLH